MEINRGRLGHPWVPFGETRFREAEIDAFAGPLATAWLAGLKESP